MFALAPEPIHHRFRFLNGVPLNDTHFEWEVNFLEYWERRPNGKERHFAWVSDLPIKESTVMEMMRAARAGASRTRPSTP